jgi:hypothetical protein
MYELKDSVKLPGTTDLNHKGRLSKDTTTLHLNRIYFYEGAAWYQKKVVIPQSFDNKHIQLILERTKSTRVWVDDRFAGESRLLQSAQIFDLSHYLSPGEHTITIRVDNSLKLTPYGGVHIYSDDTQTNWNGIIGKIELEASSKTYISDLQVFPDVKNKKATIQMAVNNNLKLANVDVMLCVKRIADGRSVELKTLKANVSCDSLIKLDYQLGSEMQLWDDYQQPLYQLTAVIKGDGVTDSKTVSFGMRSFEAKGTQFSINGRTTFLRGKHDACVFPLTGHPPMDVDGWVRVYKIAKSYGINHYRFHSYCPPEAAFTAADQVGIFLQPELPFWGGLDVDSVALMLRAEGMAMLKSYANHPSFVMFSHGNEIWSGQDRVEQNIIALKKYDSRPLYTMGSNNNIGYAGPRNCSDYFVGARTPYEKDSILSHTRLTHSFADSRDGATLNTQTPSTEVNFTYSVSNLKIPIVSHEIGQYQIFPDYKEIEKYTGILKPLNLEVFRNRLMKSGMMNQDIDFHKASGAWAALCYKAEMEAALRTPGFGGFQLLDLQDFPGQGTALVGILDAFMDSKNVITTEAWKQSCNDVVILLQFPKYCYTNTETFKATITVANYSNRALNEDLTWQVLNAQGAAISSGKFDKANIVNGKLNDLGEIVVPLSAIQNCQRLNVNVSLEASGYSNTYPVWVYPQPKFLVPDSDITVTNKLDASVFAKLQKGEKVLLFPAAKDVKNNSIAGLFPPEFWNYGMFKGISEWAKKPVSPGTLSLLTNPCHPLFNEFPTDAHTNWQWFSIIKASNPLILDKTEHKYRPVVQVIDNLERNHKLGLIFEFKVGDGKLLVCMAHLNELMDKPEACQLYQSIIHYMKSDFFNPDYLVNRDVLMELL